MDTQPASDDVEYLSVKEYAQRRGCHVQTVYTAIQMRTIPYAVERTSPRVLRIIVPRGTLVIRNRS